MGTVRCKRCDTAAEGLAAAPLPGEAGRQVLEATCAACWKAWMDQQVILMNETGMSPGEPADYEKLLGAMREYLGLGPAGVRPPGGRG